jgi:6-phosphogluconolactonase
VGAEEQRWERTDEPLELAAEIVAHALLGSGDAPRLAVAGGSAAAVLGPLRRRLGTAQWQRLRVTWVDERRVPSDSPDSNRGETYRRGWLGPSAPVGLEVPLWLDRETPEDAVRRVTQTLRDEFEGELDVLLLGMGEDGHIASLFPDHSALDAQGLVALVDDSPKPPAARITLTLPMLSTARHAVLVAAGEGKRQVLRSLRAGDTSLPVARIPYLTVVTDQDLVE